MTKLISKAYQKLNYELHKRESDYGAGAAGLANTVALIVTEAGAVTLLDYGCGKGMLKQPLSVLCPTLEIREFDPSVPGKTKRPKAADIVVCLDVMEHIEPERLDAVLADISGLALKAAFFAITSRPAKRTLADGRNAHLIIQPPGWWLEKIGQFMTINQHNGTPGRGVLLLTTPPKRP